MQSAKASQGLSFKAATLWSGRSPFRLFVLKILVRIVKPFGLIMFNFTLA
jgi:hypothetical protein